MLLKIEGQVKYLKNIRPTCVVDTVICNFPELGLFHGYLRSSNHFPENPMVKIV